MVGINRANLIVDLDVIDSFRIFNVLCEYPPPNRTTSYELFETPIHTQPVDRCFPKNLSFYSPPPRRGCFLYFLCPLAIDVRTYVIYPEAKRVLLPLSLVRLLSPRDERTPKRFDDTLFRFDDTLFGFVVVLLWAVWCYLVVLRSFVVRTGGYGMFFSLGSTLQIPVRERTMAFYV